MYRCVRASRLRSFIPNNLRQQRVNCPGGVEYLQTDSPGLCGCLPGAYKMVVLLYHFADWGLRCPRTSLKEAEY